MRLATVQTDLLHRSRQPTRLTAGPLLYKAVCPSRDGKRLFALATKQRGELVRYDSKSRQFLPFLSTGNLRLECLLAVIHSVHLSSFSRDKWESLFSYEKQHFKVYLSPCAGWK
jgi:hypothetical protein